MVRPFASHENTVDPMITINILECIRTLKDAPMSNLLKDKRELVWIH